jgi:aminomethyltransferase
MSEPELKRTPLHAAHLAAGARMAGFAGYDMPIQYPDGVMKEHAWTRTSAGLFDVSHMGQARILGADATSAFEGVTPGDFAALKPGRQKYSVLLNDTGGILDDLMAARPDDQGLFIVVNGACKDADFRFLDAQLSGDARLVRIEDHALLALQGPEAAAVLAAHVPAASGMAFMDSAALTGFGGVDLIVSRSGYTGEDGFEISLPAAEAPRVWAALLADERVRPIGLGARDSLRLEAGLPLYGHDVDPSVSPIEAGLAFALSPSRRRRGDFPGAARILAEVSGAPTRARIALKVLEGAPAREGAVIVDADGAEVGVVTSGGFSPTLGAPIAIGFAPPALCVPGQRLGVVVRGRTWPVETTDLPFVPHRYVRRP